MVNSLLRSLTPYLFWLLVVLTALLARPITPIDETRAVSVAWEMWLRGDFLVPYLNGEPYSHKPPLLAWLIQLSWWLFGVNDWTPRLISALVGLVNLGLTAALARRLWPEDPDIARLVPCVLVGTWSWGLWGSMIAYDMLVSCFALLGWLGILEASKRPLPGWTVTGLAIAGGVLSKGPVILLFILPVALCAPWWASKPPQNDWRLWYLGIIGAFLLGATLALCWAVPAGFSGGETYRKAIFWGQSAGRISQSFAHRRPFWWYIPVLPLLLLPWTLWLPFWSSLRALNWEKSLRFCIIPITCTFVIFSLISGKQVHYLLPILPLFTLVMLRALLLMNRPSTRRGQWLLACFILAGGIALNSQTLLKMLSDMIVPANIVLWPWQLLLVMTAGFLLIWHPRNLDTAISGLMMISLSFWLASHGVYFQTFRESQDLKQMALHLNDLQRQGFAIARLGEENNGDFNFLGRLQQPVLNIAHKRELPGWLANHENAYVIIDYRARPDNALAEQDAEFAQAYRGRRIVLWRSEALRLHPEAIAYFQQGKS